MPSVLRPRGSYLQRRIADAGFEAIARGPWRLKARLLLAGLGDGEDGLPAQEEADHTSAIITARVSTLVGRRIPLRLEGRRTTAC